MNLAAFMQSLVEMRDAKGNIAGEKWMRQKLITKWSDTEATVHLYDKDKVAHDYNVKFSDIEDWTFSSVGHK